MKNNMIFAVAAGLIILLSGFALVGCESDSVAPHDQTPPLTQEAVAYQAAVVAMAITEIGPRLIDLTPNKSVETYTFEGYEYVEGQVDIDFRVDGPDGDPADPGEAGYAHLYTVGENGLTITYTNAPGSATYLTANIMADLDQSGGTATILTGSEGELLTGTLAGTYAIAGLVVGGSGYPTGGTVTFTGGDHTLVVAFDGTQFAMITADGAPYAVLDLSDGGLELILPTS